MKALKISAKIIPIPKPTLFSGPGSSAELCEAIGLIGIEKLLLVTDKPLVSLGMAAQIQSALEHHGVECVVYDGVLPDPNYDQAEAGLAVFRQQGCDGILALGGGSPMDCAKVIAARATNNRPIRKLAGLLKVWRTPAPLFVIPTTAGTGSEVTLAAVVSDPVTHQKTPLIDPKLVPKMAALDPELMTGLPPGVTAATGMDALTHAVEAYISVNATEETDGYALAAIKLICRNLEEAVKDGQSLDVRQNMSLASYYAGLAFTKASLGYVHAIAHNLGARYGTPHGVANSLALPHVLEFSKHAAEARLAKLANVSDVGNEKLNDAENAQAFISYIATLQVTLGLPQTLDCLNKADIPGIARLALKEAQWNYPVPVYMDQDECESLIQKLLPT